MTGIKMPLITAGVAQLAEHNVANVVVVGSNPITRSCRFFGKVKCLTKIGQGLPLDYHVMLELESQGLF